MSEEESVRALVDDLRKFGRETEWLEFKVNDAEPEAIGEYISAIANSACLLGRDLGYVVWGVDDITNQLVGTTFAPHSRKIGNENLEAWLSRGLHPSIHYRIREASLDGNSIVVLEVPSASHTPVRFKDHEWIRVGSYKKKLRDFPEKERALWRLLSAKGAPFEEEIALSGLRAEDVLQLLDFAACFELLKQPIPNGIEAILGVLSSEKLTAKRSDGSWAITMLGAVLFASDLARFDLLRRKAPRVVVYGGRNRTQTTREQEGRRGYANGFQGLIGYIESQLPQNEQIVEALRTEARVYPSVAIRELVANALIHQDFRITGTGPMIEIFEDRIEITNPGAPLIDPQRLIDAPPESRNERLAGLARRMNICEERGSGIDKVILAVELFQLPPPRFDAMPSHTRVTLFAPRKLNEMEADDRIRACYQHCCLKWVSSEKMTNATLRKRFGIADQNYAIASRIISETIAAGLIKRSDPDSTSKKHAAYIPFFG